MTSGEGKKLMIPPATSWGCVAITFFVITFQVARSVQAKRDFEPAPDLIRGNLGKSISSGYRLAPVWRLLCWFPSGLANFVVENFDRKSKNSFSLLNLRLAQDRLGSGWQMWLFTSLSFVGPLSAFVNLTAMANGENQDNHFLVLYVAQYSVVSNSISPESGSISPQRFSKMPGVFASLDPVV